MVVINPLSRRLSRALGMLSAIVFVGNTVLAYGDDRFRSYAENQSYETSCAEVDNINIPFFADQVSAFRVTASHPTYFPTPINERGADFSTCNFVEAHFWSIGQQDGSSSEFKEVEPGDSDAFYVQDTPLAGVDMQAAEFPAGIGKGSVQSQIIQFTADEISDTNIELKIGSDLHIKMSSVAGNGANPQVTLRCETWNGETWQNQGDRTFSSSQQEHVWNIPDLSWIEGTDQNKLRLKVVPPAQGGKTTPAAVAFYDHLEMKRRAVRGDTTLEPLFQNEFISIVPVQIDFWWRYPKAMTLEIKGGKKVGGVHYFRIIKNAPGSNPPESDEIFVLYEDGNARMLPLPPEGIDWTPYGASIILSPSIEGERPVAPIKRVVIDPEDLSLDVYNQDGSVSHLEIWADQTQTVLDVTRIKSGSAKKGQPFARFRSMWAFDGKADIDRIQSSLGRFPAMDNWTALDGPWWKLVKSVPSFHNTLSPDFLVEILEPSRAYLSVQAESMEQANSYQLQTAATASAGKALRFPPDGGQLTYLIDLEQPQPVTQLRIRYADDNGGSFTANQRGNPLTAFIDGERVDATFTADTGGWDEFEISPALFLGDLAKGKHVLKLEIGPGTEGVLIDRIDFISIPASQRGIQSAASIQIQDMSTSGGVESQIALVGAASAQAVPLQINIKRDIKEAYLVLGYSGIPTGSKIDVQIDGKTAARFPSEINDAANNAINSRELFIGELSKGKHELSFTVPPTVSGFRVDHFEVISK